MIDNSGQISAEYLLLSGVLIFILLLSTVFIANEQELATAISAARSGIDEGIVSSSSAIYPKQTYNDYSKSNSDLLIPHSVEIVNITYTELGVDNNYDKKNSVQGLCKVFKGLFQKGIGFNR